MVDTDSADPGGGAGQERVGVADAADEAAIIDTIVLAFAGDPVTRWTWPQARDYVANMPRLIRAFGGRAFRHGGAYVADWVRRARDHSGRLVAGHRADAAVAALRPPSLVASGVAA